ncbi:protein ref(2)P-like [Condylostylus longicornis]|uniref:protein ref(2)P-like n=1 Tax=Condylostylus longicornis TaxID=2530218 RepID=UPI00244E146C|nr:protein ref(2)P-like [Condylostylus longicornis]
MSFLKIIVQNLNEKNCIYTELPPNYWDLLNVLQYNVADHFSFSKYWLDSENDKIPVTNEVSYKIFLSISQHKKLFLEKKTVEENGTKEITNLNDNSLDVKESKINSYENDYNPFCNIHLDIKCDGCGIQPIIGFRYQCLTCENYNLCLYCENQYIHNIHKMMRLPSNAKKRKSKKTANTETNSTE